MVGNQSVVEASAASRDAVRTAAITATLGFLAYSAFVVLSRALGWFHFDLVRVTPPLAAAILINVLLASFPWVWPTRPWAFWLYETVHAVGLTVLLHLLGGIPMGFLLMGYALAVIHSEILRPEAPVFVTANLSFVCYAVLAWAESAGFTPQPILPALEPGQQLAYVVVAFLTLNFLALYANRYGNRLRGFALELRREVEERTAALSAANEELVRAYRELRNQETHLLHAEKMASLGVLVAGVAHEINNPLSFVAGSIAPLRERLGEAIAVAPQAAAALAEAAELACVVGRGADRILGIVKDLGTFSRMNKPALERVDFHEGLEVTLRLLEPRWRDRITVHRDYGTLPLVECDPGQVNQVFMNLLANACDAIDERGNIWVTTRAVDGSVRLTIRDDGCGISPNVAGRMYDPFFTTKPQGKGTGLGLSISVGIVSAHGGRLAIEGAPNRGATALVELPISGHVAPPVDSDGGQLIRS